jgi:HD-like signal output (HDOD) protein
LEERRKAWRGPSNIVYEIDGASYGMDDRLVEAIRTSIRRRIQARNLEIPRLPRVASQILQLSRNPSTSADEIVRVIVTDPILAGRLMTLANSVALGGGRPVEGLRPALVRLGLQKVRDLVFAESIRVKIFSCRNYQPILEQSWRLSLGSALACEAMARVTGLERENAFLVGLLHDTGTPVLVSAITEHERRNNNQPLGEEPVEILLSQLHEETGAYVLQDWGMNPAIVAAAATHHRARAGTTGIPAQDLAYAANLICQHLGIGSLQRDVDFTIEHVFQRLGLDDFELISPLLEFVQRELETLVTGLEEDPPTQASAPAPATATAPNPAGAPTPAPPRRSPYRRAA